MSFTVMEYRIRKELKFGLNSLVTARGKFLDYIELDLLFLKKGEKFTGRTQGKEEVLVILAGQGKIDLGSGVSQTVGERKDVFGGKAWAIYVPFNHSYTLQAIDNLEVAIARAPSDLKADPVIVSPGEVKERIVGKGNYERRVYDIVDLNIKAKHLVVGETVNPPGNWSSFPPHKHDIDNLPEEADLEEVYLFRVKPSPGFGLIRLYNDDLSLDKAYSLRDNDVMAIREGYHPVAAPPGYSLYYLWILAGEKRVLKPRDDPKHTWINK